MNELLALAKEDIEVAKLLLEKQKYSKALYHYHQGVEKTVKHVGLSIGGISEKQLANDIRHAPIKAFKILFKYFANQIDGLLPSMNPHLFHEAQEIMESNSDENAVKLAWNMIKSVVDEDEIIQVDKFSTPFDAMCDFISKITPEIDLGLENPDLRKYMASRLEEGAKKTVLLINYGSKVLQILLVNSLICAKYRPDEFRYPSEELGNPMDYFNQDNKLIQDLYFFINSMEISINISGKIDW